MKEEIIRIKQSEARFHSHSSPKYYTARNQDYLREAAEDLARLECEESQYPEFQFIDGNGDYVFRICEVRF